MWRCPGVWADWDWLRVSHSPSPRHTCLSLTGRQESHNSRLPDNVMTLPTLRGGRKKKFCNISYRCFFKLNFLLRFVFLTLYCYWGCGGSWWEVSPASPLVNINFCCHVVLAVGSVELLTWHLEPVYRNQNNEDVQESSAVLTSSYYVLSQFIVKMRTSQKHRVNNLATANIIDLSWMFDTSKSSPRSPRPVWGVCVACVLPGLCCV